VLQFLEVRELVTARVCRLSIPAEFHVGGVHLYVSPSLCVCVTFHLGFHVRVKVVSEIQSFNTHIISGAAIFLSSWLVL
jgi:hypothetical protein